MISALQAFWEWSWQEHMEYDLKSMIEHVYSVTKSKVLFVGHSQVCHLLSFFLLNFFKSLIFDYMKLLI